MAPPAWAFQSEYFLAPPDEELICSICSLVFCDPTECPCQHAFCKKCICRWLELQNDCPICRKMVLGPLRPSAPFVRNLISKMKMWCHNKESGCSATFTLESCEHHLKECEFETVECLCGKSMMRKDIPNHDADKCLYGGFVMETEDEKEKNQIERELESLRGKAIGKMAVRCSEPNPSTSSSSSTGAATGSVPRISNVWSTTNWFSRSMHHNVPEPEEGGNLDNKIMEAIAIRKKLLDRRKRKLEIIRSGLLLHSRPPMKKMQVGGISPTFHEGGSSGSRACFSQSLIPFNTFTPMQIIKAEKDINSSASSGSTSDRSFPFPSTSSAFSSGRLYESGSLSPPMGCRLKEFLTTYKNPFIPKKTPKNQSSSLSSFASAANSSVAEIVASAISHSDLNGSDSLPSASGESSLDIGPQITSVYPSDLIVPDLGTASSTSYGARNDDAINCLPQQGGVSKARGMSVIHKAKESPDDVCDIVYDSRQDRPPRSRNSKSLFNTQLNPTSSEDIDFWLFRRADPGSDDEGDHSYASAARQSTSCTNGESRKSQDQASTSVTNEPATDAKSKTWYAEDPFPFVSSLPLEQSHVFIRPTFNLNYVRSGSHFPNSSYSNLDAPMNVINHLPSTSALGADPLAVSGVLAAATASSANNMPSQTSAANGWEADSVDDEMLSYCLLNP